jgi:hypothetical protein
MRPKVVFALIVCALVVLGTALILKPHAGKMAAPAPVETAAAPAPEVAKDVPVPMPPPAPVEAPHVLTAEERQDAIQAEVEQLQEWSRNDDPQSLSNILMGLTNSEKEVREAAIEATKQFGSTNAIPALKSAAMNSTDTDEQMAMLDAANFLTLTPISDSGVQLPLTPQQIQADAQRQAQHEAQRQAQMQQRSQQNQGQGQNQNTPQPPSQAGPN